MQNYFQRLGTFELISFITGFALMAFELVAARILAPTIGSSIFVWTSVIGVIIAALSVGYAVGGKLADMRVQPRDIAWLLLVTALSVLMTLASADMVLTLLLQGVGDSRLQGVVASLLLFAPTSFLLGIISPYLVRLRVSSAKTSGESVALLSALNSIGGITGTFLTGFVLFGFVGTTQALLVVAMILVVTSWLVVPRQQRSNRIVFTLLLALAALFLLFPAPREGVVASINSPTAAYEVHEGVIGGKNKPVRLLATGPTGYQSGVYLDGRNELLFFYTKKFADVVAAAPHKSRVLILGGGALTVPQYLAQKYPHMQIDVVEIDPELTQIAKTFFHYESPKNVQVINQDARVFLNKNTSKYDIILSDVYSDSAIPFALTTKEYAKEIERALSQHGIVVANFVAGYNRACAPLLKGLHAAYAEILPRSVAFPQFDASLEQRQNIVIVYGRDTMPWLSRDGSSRAHIAQTASFTDNFAPIEHLVQQCQRSG